MTLRSRVGHHTQRPVGSEIAATRDSGAIENLPAGRNVRGTPAIFDHASEVIHAGSAYDPMVDTAFVT